MISKVEKIHTFISDNDLKINRASSQVFRFLAIPTCLAVLRTTGVRWWVLGIFLLIACLYVWYDWVYTYPRQMRKQGKYLGIEEKQ